MYQRSSWTFNQEVTNQFEEHVRKSLPFYERIQEMVISISDYFMEDSSVVYDLGCATGETIHRLQKQHPQKQIRYVGLDASHSMIEKARSLAPSSSTEWQVAKIEDYLFPSKSSFVISILTLHFLPIHQRKNVIQRVYDALNEGGCFILVEKTLSDHSTMQHVWSHLHYEEKLQQGFSHQEVLEKEQSLRGVLTPLTINENLLLLKETGFHTDVFFKEWNFTGFMAIKPLSQK